jgi:UDP-2,4-diacetamido-2,4,6-trideoxy-beta-L-altropyranose hydrolase
MKTVAIIQGRMGSRRLPGKILMDIAGEPLIAHVIRRTAAANVFDEVIVATTQESEDDAVAAYCEAAGVPCFRGSEDDVLDRYYQAAKTHGAGIIARITADCPLHDPTVIRRIVKAFDPSRCDYVSNALERTYPDGLDTEVFSVEALERAHREAKLPSEREHVTPYIHKHPEIFRIGHVMQDTDRSALRWTVDEPRDLAFVRAVFAELGNRAFGQEEIVELLERKPELQKMNEGIVMNAGYLKSLADDPKATHVLFRVDAGAAIGTGHVMRCLALAQAMHDAEIWTIFLCADLPDVLRERLEREGCSVRMTKGKPYGQEDAHSALAMMRETGAKWIVVDGYAFDGAYQEMLKRGGARILWIDDYGHAGSYCADVVLNQNVSADEDLYRNRSSETRLLLGPEYVLLRREFCVWKDRRGQRSGPVRRLLVTLGGTDPKHITEKVTAAVEKAGYTGSVAIVSGKTDDMPAEMAKADFAIAAAGTTSWELLFMGVPFLTGAFADNQIPVAETLQKKDLADSAGWYPDVTEESLASRIAILIADDAWRTEHSRRGIETIDGEGVTRALRFMELPAITLRSATMDDARLLFTWANDADVRSSSFSPQPIAWETHEAWLRRKLSDVACAIFIAESAGLPVGQIRFDLRDDGDSEVDVHTAPEARGKGYGSTIIHEGVRLFLKEHGGTAHAFVRKDNEASRKAFLRAGFLEKGIERIQGEEVYHLTSP